MSPELEVSRELLLNPNAELLLLVQEPSLWGQDGCCPRMAQSRAVRMAQEGS